MAIRIAVIGFGYWGKNIARVLRSCPDFSLTAICDTTEKARARARALYPDIRVTDSLQSCEESFDAVAIVTPVGTHLSLSQEYLSKGKHVLMSKPCCTSFQDARNIFDLSTKYDRCLFVDHTFVFNPAVRALKELLPRIGKPLYISSQRLNLGLFQNDVNVIWDLMPHDLSIISYLLQKKLSSAQTFAYRTAALPQEDTAHSSFMLEDGTPGAITVSWLAPAKIRELLIIGQDGMLSYDDVAVAAKVKLYTSGISFSEEDIKKDRSSYAAKVNYRVGDLFSPAISTAEALEFEMTEFAAAIHVPTKRAFYSNLALDTMRGLQVVVDGMTRLPNSIV